MAGEPEQGTERLIDGRLRVFYDGYWIKSYEVPADTLLAKKRLIEALTRRLFNHVEYGLNVPGTRMEEARRAFELETNPRRKRVKGAMLAGSLFNRAADIFTKLVELQALGVQIQPDNALMRQCGQHLQEALSLGKMVLHRSGEEGIDELWGEPFKAFCFPIEEFYKSRYVKIAQTMRAIDQVATALIDTLEPLPMFAGVEPLVIELARAGKVKCETLRTDEDVFDVWASLVASAEELKDFQPRVSSAPTPSELQQAAQGTRLLKAGQDLIFFIARARVPMPKSTADLLERCEQFHAACAPASRVSGSLDPNGHPLAC